MADTKTTDMLLEDLTTDTGEPATAEHDAWFRAQVKSTLEKRERGDMTYTPLDEAAKQFGL